LRTRTRIRRFRVGRVPFSRFVLRDAFSALPSASGPVDKFTEGVGSLLQVLCSRMRFRRFRARRDPFSRFALPDAFSALPSASGPVFMFCAPESVLGVTELVGSRFHILRPGRFFGGSVRVGTRLQVLRSRTRFRRYQVRPVPFSRCALPDAFTAIPSASGPICTFCAPGRVFGITECVGSRFHALHPRTRLRRLRARRDPFSRFVLPDMFSALLRASGPVFKFCAPGRVFGVTECVLSRFHILRSWARFRRCRLGRVPFSRFALRDAFSSLPSASGPVFKFYPPGRFFGVFLHDRSRFHVLRSRTRFLRFRVRRVPFQRFAIWDAFSA